MKETSKKRTPNNGQIKHSARTDRRDLKLSQEDARKTPNAKELKSKASNGIHCLSDVDKFEETPRDSNAHDMIDDQSTDMEEEANQKEEDSDCDTLRDSISSQADSLTADEDKVEIISRVPKNIVRTTPSKTSSRKLPVRSGQETKKSQSKALHEVPKRLPISKGKPSKLTTRSSLDNDLRNAYAPSEPSTELSDGTEGKTTKEVYEIGIMEAVPINAQSAGIDNQTNGIEENRDRSDDDMSKKIEEMETKIEKLEDELREVAALEISLYSVVPEHGSSVHKVHTPARRLSRLYIHAGKHWTRGKRATIARNTVSGLVLVAKSCGNDVPRLTFWLSNTLVLREIISQAFSSSSQSSPVAMSVESNGDGRRKEGKGLSLKWNGEQASKPCIIPVGDDWQETKTFTTALEKVESWIFSRIVESLWWQILTPKMQTPVKNWSCNKSLGNILGPELGDQHQVSFSVNLWKDAFEDAFQRLCPVRAGGNECGCLPVLARRVMEQCITRLDVAMFNAILRESALEIPTDPISDPILDSKVLPIPAGVLSSGSGAQLKNTIGNWSRWLTDLFGMDADESSNEDDENDDKRGRFGEHKSFKLLNALSDLLMLPKDMLIDRSIRKEVCPLTCLPLLKRILCNFTPDEFCPDPVPGAVLEAINAECVVERRLSGEYISSFPFAAGPVVYIPPSPSDVAGKVAEAGGKSELGRNLSIVQKKGYTSDEELQELDSPLQSIFKPTLTVTPNGAQELKGQSGSVHCANVRYELLREVWSV